MSWVYVERTQGGRTKIRKYTHYALQEIFQFMGCKHCEEMADILLQDLANVAKAATSASASASLNLSDPCSAAALSTGIHDELAVQYPLITNKSPELFNTLNSTSNSITHESINSATSSVFSTPLISASASLSSLSPQMPSLRINAALQAALQPRPVLSDQQFCDTIRRVMQLFECEGETHWRDFEVALRIKSRQQSVCLLLGGTSGCGKSTLASLVGSRMSITTVLSTDNIRHLLRTFHSKEECPVLWTSSYYAGDALSPSTMTDTDKLQQPALDSVIEGFEAQNQVIYDKLDDIITSFERRRESLIIEGVHLSVRQVKKLMVKHPSCVPLLVYISNESKHTERFAIRAKYMTLEPRMNKYIKYFKNIRQIQKYLCSEADQAKIPKIDNTNVDRSLAILHRTLFSTLARLAHDRTNNDNDGSQRRLVSVYDPKTETTAVLHEEYSKVYSASWSSKVMLQRIRETRKTTDTEEGSEDGQQVNDIDAQIGDDERQWLLPKGLKMTDVEDMDEDTLKFASLGS